MQITQTLHPYQLVLNANNSKLYRAWEVALFPHVKAQFWRIGVIYEFPEETSALYIKKFRHTTLSICWPPDKKTEIQHELILTLTQKWGETVYMNFNSNLVCCSILVYMEKAEDHSPVTLGIVISILPV